MVWGKAGSTTLATSGDDLDITSMTASKFNQVMSNVLLDSNSVYGYFTFNSDTSSVYASRNSANGGAETTATSGANSSTIWQTLDTAGEEAFTVMYTCAIVGQEKLSMFFNVDNDAGTGGVAPNRRESVFKYVPSPDATITSVELNNAGSGDYAISTNISALGSDITTAAAIPFAENAQVGSRAEITDTRKMYHYTYDWFLEGTTIPPQPSTRGLFAGGEVSTDTVDYITIATAGNATDFGNLTVGRYNASAVSSGTRAVFMGGNDGTYSNVMDYVTVATTGNAIDFGNLTVAIQSGAGVSSETRGVIGGGTTGSVSNVIQYITIATAGDSTDFGNLTSSRHSPSGVSSGTRGVWGGGFTSGNVNTIDYVTIATTGDATTFGNLTASRRAGAGCGSTTRGLFGGGYEGGHVNKIDYITIDANPTANATDFGDLTRSNNVLGACSSNTRGVWGGGNNTNVNTIDYVTIDTLGNANDFGDLTAGRAGVVGTDGY